jgi:hypothetical protein
MIDNFAGHRPDWQLLPTAIAVFCRRVVQIALLLADESAVQFRIMDYVALVAGTQVVASAVGFYARFRCTATARELFTAMRRDVAGAVTAPAIVWAWLTGLAQRGPVAPGQIVARAVAWPWFIPAVCAAVFVITNRLFNLFPLALALVPLLVYGIALSLWAVAEELDITNRRFGGALIGLTAAIAAVMLSSMIGAQAWMLRFQVGAAAKLSLLTTYLPVYVAAIISIERGMRIGWRNAGRKLDAAGGV